MSETCVNYFREKILFLSVQQVIRLRALETRNAHDFSPVRSTFLKTFCPILWTK